MQETQWILKNQAIGGVDNIGSVSASSALSIGGLCLFMKKLDLHKENISVKFGLFFFLTCTEQSVEQHTTGQRELKKIVHFNGFFKSVLIWSDLLEIKPKLNFATFP